MKNLKHLILRNTKVIKLYNLINLESLILSNMNNSFNLNSLTKLKKLIFKNFDYIEIPESYSNLESVCITNGYINI